MTFAEAACPALPCAWVRERALVLVAALAVLALGETPGIRGSLGLVPGLAALGVVPKLVDAVAVPRPAGRPRISEVVRLGPERVRECRVVPRPVSDQRMPAMCSLWPSLRRARAWRCQRE